MEMPDVVSSQKRSVIYDDCCDWYINTNIINCAHTVSLHTSTKISFFCSSVQRMYIVEIQLCQSGQLMAYAESQNDANNDARGGKAILKVSTLLNRQKCQKNKFLTVE